MSAATLVFNVTGDSYWELREKADAVLVEFLRDDDSDESDISDYKSFFSISYEMAIDENRDMEVDSDYVAEVTARVKPRR